MYWHASQAAIPDKFDNAFLDWFRERTEQTWASYRPKSFEDFATAKVGGYDWQTGTRWLGGLSEAEIEQVECQWSVRFPPDYRLFLQRLHALDRPMRGASFALVKEHGKQRSQLVASERTAFSNWLTDQDVLLDRWRWLIDGIQFDVEHNDLWLSSWGDKPATLIARKASAEKLVTTAPRLIPLFLHRYLLAEPCGEGNPVFSIYQSDTVVYGPDLRSYFLVEFADLLGINEQTAQRKVNATIQARSANYAAIPFWGELLFAD